MRATETAPETHTGTRPGAPSERRRLVVVANRLPVRRVEQDGSDRWETSPGGLVAALHPLLQDRGGAWVGWDGTVSEGQATAPFTHERIEIRPVGMSPDERDAFYYGFCNETIWPLYHDCVRPPEFHRRWWRPYREMNTRFAEAAVEVSNEDDLIWVHDYQLQLAPGHIRMRRPHARIGFFNHIPFPPEELFAKLPWRTQILEGLLGSDVIGFQTKLAAQNFARAARRFTSAHGSDTKLQYEGRTVRVGAFPISIDYGLFDRMARSPDIVAASQRLRESLDYRRIILGVDRLDYTKGVDLRLRAYEEVLTRGSVTAEDTVFVQVAVPTREKVGEYADLRSSVNEHVGRINGSHSRLGRVAVQYIYRSLPWEELVACYRAADVMIITPYRDGMNLVAKEYVATRTDDTGVLVLSEFAGAALELKQALLVNPHDVNGIADSIERSLALDPSEASQRMGAMRRTVRRHDVFAWSDSFLRELAS